jgi:hypothetical protein
VYITSDEEIKEGDYIISLVDDESFEIVWKCDKSNIENMIDFDLDFQKIILTTDQDLIKDGVQAIDDEFLEWFVNNPSCERVEVDKEPFDITEKGEWLYEYKIIIPRNTQQVIDEDFDGGLTMGQIIPQEEPKQETVEEIAERLFPVHIKSILDKYDDGVTNVVGKEDINEDCRESFIDGAKWQAERMYSKEDMRKAYFSGVSSTREGWNGEYAGGNSPNIEKKFSKEFTQWFKQNKKK